MSANLVREAALSRLELIALHTELGGPAGAALNAANDADLAGLVERLIARTTDIDKLDAVLLRPLPLETRAALAWRRSELANAARKVTPPVRPTGFKVKVPAELGITDVVAGGGRIFKVHIEAGQLVCEMEPVTFKTLLSGPQGKQWADANNGTDVWERMRPGMHL